jgi:heavy metal sensor kinase
LSLQALLAVLISKCLSIFVLGGAGAYWLAGIALRPVRQVSAAARRINANSLHTRLAQDGPNDEIKELSDTFDGMLERLERTFEQQSRFVGDIAHELRTPLASLRTNLEVVIADEDATLDDYRTMAATQERALTRLERLVADLLILAKSEQPLAVGEVMLESLLEEAVDELRQAANTREVRIQLITKAEVIIPGDESLLARVFSNLIENGIHYNHPGGEVVITIDRKDDRAVVTVADTGIGIPSEEQAHIFERLYRVDSSRARHRGGAGLGLSIVFAIVQQHGGQVHVESIPAVGSTFTVLLPL